MRDREEDEGGGGGDEKRNAISSTPDLPGSGIQT